MKNLVCIVFVATLFSCNNEGDAADGPTVDSTTNKIYSTSVTLDTAVNPGADTSGGKTSGDSLQ